MTGIKIRKVVTIVLAVVLWGGLMAWAPVSADDESSVEAEVEVLPGDSMSYGIRVYKSKMTLFPGWSLREPDGRGAFMMMNAWISIELENVVPATGTVSIWMANKGWQSSTVRIYTSTDGKRWKLVARQKLKSGYLSRYDFTGSFGDVRYIRVDRSGGRWSWLLLDAVGAKGGD